MAYASVLSAMHQMERLGLCSNPETKPIYDELSSLASLLHEEYAQMHGSKLRFDPLEEQVEDVATKIEDLMILIKQAYASFCGSCSESSNTKSPGAGDECKTTANSSFFPGLLKVRQLISSLIVKLKQSKKDYFNMEEDPQQHSRTAKYLASLTENLKLSKADCHHLEGLLPEISAVGDAVSSSSRICDDVRSEIKLVGLEDEGEQLLEKLLGRSSVFFVESVVGMVGIGKTALVKHVYDHPRVKDAFDCRLWVTIGPNYNFQEFIRLVSGQIAFPKRSENLGMDEFGSFLYKYLYPRRYLIVLDDFWSIQVFNNLKKFFPNYGNKSKIILTTRLANVADRITYGIHQKRFLSDNDNWDLLHRMVFTTPGEHCSYELQKYGKKIAKNCEGLPLAILAVGKQLCKEEKTVEYWKEVSEQENLHDIIKDDYENISGTLFLSYKMLPRRLKECFLYIGIVPNYEILVSTLIKLWCAEEFFRPLENKSIEDVAEEYLKELVSQSVVLAREQSTRKGRIKICRVHFVFRYLCVTEAENEKFCLIIKKYVDCSRKGTSKQRRICIHNNVVLGIKGSQDGMASVSGVCSVLSLGPLHQYLQRVHFRFRLLKVLNALNIRFYKFPDQVVGLVRLKYFAMTYDGEIPKSMSQLSNLEVLVVGRFHSIISSSARPCMPVEIWNLNWLKHLQCIGIDLLDPCNQMILEHLISLSGVSARSCSQGVLSRVPNLKKLGIHIELAPDEVQNFSFLNDIAQHLLNLESFKCVVHGLSSQVVRSPNLGFPDSLIKITLSGCRFAWNQMATIGGLPCLEVLKLRCYAFCGPHWIIANEKEFPSLKVLLLEDLDVEEISLSDPYVLQSWVGPQYLKRLERLIIRHCYKLREIPPIQHMKFTLTVIEINDCSPLVGSSVVESGQKIAKSFRYNNLRVCVNSSWDDIGKNKRSES